jgi:hypothetical protein
MFCISKYYMILKHGNFARVAFGWCAGNKHGTLFVFIHKATNYSELKL